MLREKFIGIRGSNIYLFAGYISLLNYKISNPAQNKGTETNYKRQKGVKKNSFRLKISFNLVVNNSLNFNKFDQDYFKFFTYSLR
jgi:hypothetical protein